MTATPTTTSPAAPSIRLLPPSAAAGSAAAVTKIINAAFGGVEADDIFNVPDKKRTTESEVARYILASEFLVAYDAPNTGATAAADEDSKEKDEEKPKESKAEEVIVGCVRVSRIDARTAGLGMLAVGDAVRGTGVGRLLVAAAEQWARDRLGCDIMQIELLRPSTWKHTRKEMLAAWYLRLAYVLLRVARPDEFVPGLEAFLATPCDFEIYQKVLA
ncbi:MAG: hypothetical protein M1819_005248 [Sarea resinae]|nr:MAG: hypothetical protein M1819_005248 [Sarea resinae]